MLNKSDFTAKMAERHGITKAQASKELGRFLDTLSSSVVEDGGVNLVGYIRLETVDVPEKSGEMNGVAWTKPAHKTVKAKVGKILKDIVE